MSIQLKRYAAKLLFQFRVSIEGVSNIRRTVEEKIVLVSAPSAKTALNKIKKKAKQDEYDYLNDDGNPVYFEFVGVIDMQHLGIECSEDEVWYDVKDMLSPMERKDKLIPAEYSLSAIKLETKTKYEK